MNNGERYQKRKLNKCCVHGCKDNVLRFDQSSDRVFFICRGHGLLLDLMDKDLENFRKVS